MKAVAGSEPGPRDGPARRFGVPLALTAIAALSVIIRLPFLSIPMFSDEGAYAYIAWFWAQGDGLYTDLVVYRPQAMFALYRLILSAFGTELEAIRLFAAAYNAATLVVVFVIARYFIPAGYALLAAALFAVFSLGRIIEGFTANGELFLNLPATISAACLLWATRSGRTTLGYAAAGLFAGVAFQLKPSGASALVLGGLFPLWMALSLSPSERVSVVGKAWLALGAGCAVSLVPALLHGLSIGWATYFFQAIGFSVTRASPTSQPLLPFLLKGAVSLAIFLIDNVLLVMLLLARVLFPRLPPTFTPESFLWLWLLSAVMGIVAGGSWWLHYYIAVVPPLSVLAAVAVWQAFGAFQRNLNCYIWTVFTVGAAVYTLALFLQPYPPIFLPESAEVAAYVAARTTPEQRIHVAGSDPEIYYHARRRSAYKYLFLAEPELPRVPEAVDELAALLDDPARRPLYVVIPPGGKIKGFRLEVFFAAVERNYTLEYQTGKTDIYRARDGR